MDEICRRLKLRGGIFGYVFLFVVFWFAPLLCAAGSVETSKAIIAYVFPQDRAIDVGEVDGRKVTRINYAFANVKDGRVVAGFSHDVENLALLTGLKRENPALTVVV